MKPCILNILKNIFLLFYFLNLFRYENNQEEFTNVQITPLHHQCLLVTFWTEIIYT